jgi:hypothetical protein
MDDCFWLIRRRSWVSYGGQVVDGERAETLNIHLEKGTR